MWNSLSCNPSFQEFLRKKESKRLKESLTQIDKNGTSEGIRLVKLSRIGSKKLRLREENLKGIEKTNHLLLKKMLEINNTPSALNKGKIKPSLLGQSLNLRSRVRTINKIASENRKILVRLQSTQSVYSTEKWENSFKHHELVKMTHSKSRKLKDDKTIQNKSVFSICSPDVFEDIKSKFYQNYE